MLKFEDTKLLKNATVEKAYNVMRTFFQDGDDFAAQAIRAGEIITQHAKTPDPDAIAASILMNGMVVSLEPAQFEDSVSPKAVEYLKQFYDLDLDNLKFTNAGEQQVLLAQSMMGLEDVQKEINNGVEHFLQFRDIQQVLDANERALNGIAARKTTETDMLAAAQAQLAAAQQSLADIVTKREKALAFENTGLPDHPVIRTTYEAMKAFALDGDPLGGYALTNAGIARVIVETGASQDPEVISAALLNQYSVVRPGFKKPSDLSPRIGELYEQSSPWADLGKSDKTSPKSQDALTIRHAAVTYFLEEQVAAYKAWSQDAKKFDKYTAESLLEGIDSLKTKLDAAAAQEPNAALKARMEKSALEADTLMNAPENTQIRKPGSPKREPGW